MAEKKISRPKGKDEGAAYGKEKLGKGYTSKGTLDGALAGAKAQYRKDPAARYTPHDGE